ncbi:MAG TPA: DUF4097 family beta strand repeat-containing protein [Pyrinomonadaceae bacterium]|nr:DUF4097 family beta strand repeat-containing protein [Pyrinomonadaceae bacterium]
MNNKIVWLCALAFALSLSAIGIASAPKASTSFHAGSPQTRQQYPISGEINNVFELGPNAQIEVSRIEGSVKIETANTDRAELHFVRHARTQRDYDCETIDVQHTGNSLTIDHRRNSSCRVIQAYEELTLLVPQSANLSLSRLEGDVAVNNTSGYLQMRGIEGSVHIGEAQAARIESVEGDVNVGVRQLDEKGISIRNVEGDVALRLVDGLNANLNVRHAAGVAIDLPNVPNRPARANSFQSDDEDDSARHSMTILRLGGGGPDLSIVNIEGNVAVRRL